MPSIAASERKYFRSGRASKMSDNEHALPVLRDCEVLSVKHLPLAVVPDRIQRKEDGCESASLLVAEESLDVLKQ
jgi:hypothetical protein